MSELAYYNLPGGEAKRSIEVFGKPRLKGVKARLLLYRVNVASFPLQKALKEFEIPRTKGSGAAEQRSTEEGRLLKLFKSKKTLKVGERDTFTQVFVADETSEPFTDYVEASSQIKIRFRRDIQPLGISQELLDETRRWDSGHGTEYTSKLNSAGYPRLIGFSLEPGSGNVEKVLTLEVAKSVYGIAFLNELTTARKDVRFKALEPLKREHQLNALSVRVGLVHVHNNNRRLLFQLRAPRQNATYGGSWDVSAAGYVDPSPHKHSKDNGATISPYLACKFELSEELAIPKEMLPWEENVDFFGLQRNVLTGQLDLMAVAWSESDYDVDKLNSVIKAKGSAFKVLKVEDCILDPKHVARFIASKDRWVPQGIVTAIYILRGAGFALQDIVGAFEEQDVLKGLYLRPY